MTSRQKTSFAQQCKAFEKGFQRIAEEYSQLQRSATQKLTDSQNRIDAQDAKIAEQTRQLESVQAELGKERALRLTAEDSVKGEAEHRADLRDQLLVLAARLEDKCGPGFRQDAPLSRAEASTDCKQTQIAEKAIISEPEADDQAAAAPMKSSAASMPAIQLPDDIVSACERSVALGDAPNVTMAALQFMRAGLRISAVVSPVLRTAPRDSPPP
jgi:chromosome segregation ATPase